LLSGNAAPIAGAQVSAVDLNGVTIGGASAVSTASGEFAFCVPSGQEFATQVEATGDVTTYVEDLVLHGNFRVVEIPLSASDTVTAYSLLLSGFDPSKALVIVEIASVSGQPPCNDVAGWVFGATQLDGGTMAYQNAYVGTDGLPHVTALTSTAALARDGGAYGVGFLYNVDPSVTDAILLTATQIDAGATCAVNGGGPFTSRVAIANSAFSFAPLALP
jgi:hypothetical protein